MRGSETHIPLKLVGEKVKDRAWLGNVKKSFIRKFYAASTLATKNTKRKKTIEIPEGMGCKHFPLDVDTLTTLAAVLDSTGMRAGDQYLAEAKAMHVEGGHDWTLLLEKQLSSCKRAMQRGKGPECRAKEVRVSAISEDQWTGVCEGKGEPKRVAWFYAWATVWMLRAIEAANMKASDVVLKFEEKLVRLHVRKSKTDQKGSGTWRTFKCCQKEQCARDCAFNLAILALNDLGNAEKESPLFPDSDRKPVSKIHMVTAWARHLDEAMSGHSARRSGAMCYARKGLSIQAIQFLGRWKSSAVFRYVEEAMTEIPLNVTDGKTAEAGETQNQEANKKKRALRPKSKAAPSQSQREASEEPTRGLTKPLVPVRSSPSQVQRPLDEAPCRPGRVGNTVRSVGYDLRLELRQKEREGGVDPKPKAVGLTLQEVPGAREWAQGMELHGQDPHLRICEDVAEE